MKKCMWCTEECWCELKAGVSDDDSCDGSEADMWECNYVTSTAEWPGEERTLEKVIEDWLEEE